MVHLENKTRKTMKLKLRWLLLFNMPIDTTEHSSNYELSHKFSILPLHVNILKIYFENY